MIGIVLGLMFAVQPSSIDDHAARLYDRSLIAIAHGDIAAAETALEAIVDEVPLHPDADFDLAMLLSRQGKWSRCAELLQRAVESDPTHVEAAVRLGEARLIGLGDPASAVEPLEDALRHDPANVRAARLLAQAWVRLGQPERALAVLVAEGINGAWDAPTQTIFAQALASAGRLEEAAGEFRAALELDPRHAPALIGLGNVLRRLGRTADAAPVLESFRETSREDDEIIILTGFVRADPTDLDSWFRLGMRYLGRASWTRAANAFAHCVAASPDDPSPREALGYALLQGGSAESALVQFRWLVTRFPNVPEYRNSLGAAYLKAKQPKRAAAEFSQAVRLKPNEPGFRANLAEAYEQAGMTEQAEQERRAFEKLVSP
ncbi:tetratricopeptide repeat protein [Candidatus Poribacteria bacterium]|nr:tetratricopeptide repeat protein [Candidatus Poribacteria bacterium]